MVCGQRLSDFVQEINWLSQPDGIFIKAIAGYLIKDLSEVSVTRLLFAKN